MSDAGLWDELKTFMGEQKLFSEISRNRSSTQIQYADEARRSSKFANSKAPPVSESKDWFAKFYDGGLGSEFNRVVFANQEICRKLLPSEGLNAMKHVLPKRAECQNCLKLGRSSLNLEQARANLEMLKQVSGAGEFFVDYLTNTHDEVVQNSWNKAFKRGCNKTFP